MDKKHIVGNYKTTKLRYHDGKERIIYYTNEETLFPNEEQIASCSDTNGVIINANKAFSYMSGYSRRELIDMPHYILHHPDMPKAVFKAMWKELKENGRWRGYVKNLRKDGGFYWVHAHIFSNTRNGKLVGYTSSRRSVERSQITQYEDKYRHLLSLEK